MFVCADLAQACFSVLAQNRSSGRSFGVVVPDIVEIPAGALAASVCFPFTNAGFFFSRLNSKYSESTYKNTVHLLFWSLIRWHFQTLRIAQSGA